jgi:hypothetical protein
MHKKKVPEELKKKLVKYNINDFLGSFVGSIGMVHRVISTEQKNQDYSRFHCIISVYGRPYKCPHSSYIYLSRRRHIILLSCILFSSCFYLYMW